MTPINPQNALKTIYLQSRQYASYWISKEKQVTDNRTNGRDFFPLRRPSLKWNMKIFNWIAAIPN
jgi:hypothetical protein